MDDSSLDRHKVTIEALRRSDERFRSIFEFSCTGIAIETTEGQFAQANQAFCDMLGYTEVELLEMNWRDVSHPDDVVTSNNLDQKVASGEIDHFRYDKRYIRKTGEVIWVDFTASFIRDAEGQILYNVCQIYDITERKRGENSLREANINLEQRIEERSRELQRNEAMLASIVNNLPTEIAVKDTSGRYMLVNPQFASRFGVQNFEVLGKTIRELDFVSPEYAEKITEQDKLINETLEVIRDENEYVLPDGQSGRELVIKFPVFDVDGAITGIGTIATDITELKLAEDALFSAKEEAEIANRAKSEFLATMSHELRTPLNAIIGFSELLTREIFGPHGDPRYADYTTAINVSGNHLLEIINDILDISKIEAGEEEIIDTEINVAKAVSSCIAMLKTRSQEAGIRVEIDISENLPSLRADERLIKQVVINLLSNAVKFTCAGGNITVHACLDDNLCMKVMVTDTGVGIDAEDIPKVLLPFGQVAESVKREHGGTGLGLPICKSLMELHGGTLGIASEPGTGTTVTVRFPPDRTIQQ